jgi:hypothetical protein
VDIAGPEKHTAVKVAKQSSELAIKMVYCLGMGVTATKWLDNI